MASQMFHTIALLDSLGTPTLSLPLLLPSPPPLLPLTNLAIEDPVRGNETGFVLPVTRLLKLRPLPKCPLLQLLQHPLLIQQQQPPPLFQWQLLLLFQ